MGSQRAPHRWETSPNRLEKHSPTTHTIIPGHPGRQTTKKAGRSLCQVLPGEKGPIPRLMLMQLNNVRLPLRIRISCSKAKAEANQARAGLKAAQQDSDSLMVKAAIWVVYRLVPQCTCPAGSHRCLSLLFPPSAPSRQSSSTCPGSSCPSYLCIFPLSGVVGVGVCRAGHPGHPSRLSFL